MMFRELVGGAGSVGGQEKEWMGCILDDLRVSASTLTSGRSQPRTRGNGIGWRNKAEFFMTKWIAAERAKVALRHAVICPNVTGRTKERVAQSKRARTGLLAAVD